MYKFLFLTLFAFSYCTSVFSQNTSEIKNYPTNYAVGEVNLLQQWVESNGKNSAILYSIEVPASGMYSVAAIANMQSGTVLPIAVDQQATPLRVVANENGWQKNMVVSLQKNNSNTIYLSAGKHTIKLSASGNIPPLVDAISFSRSGTHAALDKDWQKFSSRLANWKTEQPINNTPAADKYSTGTEKVLSNPEGNYEHAIDTAFSYSTCQYINLVAGTTYTFSTSGSTKDPVLHLFNPTTPDNNTWYSDDYNGTWESNLVVTIPVTGIYVLLARPYYQSQSGTTTISQNGVVILSNTPIAGQRFATTYKSGLQNYFTCKLTGTSPDTRLFTLTSPGGAVNGYNDDYTNTSGGTWAWGLSSRIQKNYANGANYAYVCAYSASRTGSCDLYMGNVAATLPTSGEASNFPVLKVEDAIQTASGSTNYNCIAWSGGITTSWVWPLDPTSTWYVANNPLASFDKFYSNTPLRYPGAWNYTRTGATVANSVVDLWKTPSGYTHASVTKPGNDNPHGYDWESKPGSFDRTLHPRNALEGNGYGAVSNYYRFTGTFAFFQFISIPFKGYATDADAVKAGAAIIDKATLNSEAQEKLSLLISKIDADFVRQFNELYAIWDKTKQQNAFSSDPSAYCRNTEFENLAALSKKNTYNTMLLVFDKYVNHEDHYLSSLLWSLTKQPYEKLLNEVKAERIASINDAKGKYKIHGDHDNGVLYIEKILKQLVAAPTTPSDTQDVLIGLSPNPVKDVLTVKLTLKANSIVSVQAISAQSRKVLTLQTQKELNAGVYQFNCNIKNLGATTGDIITVLININGTLQSAKVMVL